MKHLLLTTIAAVVLVGCGESKQLAPPAEVKPVEPVAEAAKPEPPTAKAPDIPIHNAARTGNIEAVKQHLAAGTDVNAKDSRERTPLHRAAFGGHREIAELLIANGADVNAKDVNGVTPLHWAAGYGHKKVTELLLTKGADLNAKDGSTRLSSGRTPLDWAFFNQQPETVALLSLHGGKTKKELEAAGK